MANVKFSETAFFPLNTSPTAAQILVGYDFGGTANFAVSAQTLNEVTIPALAADGDFGFGSLIYKDWTSGQSLSTGRLSIWRYDTGAAATQWINADNTNPGSVDTSSGLMAICSSTANDGSHMIGKGVVKVPTGGATWAATDNGAAVYLGASGLVTITPPGTGDIQRIIGVVLDGVNGIIYFNPDDTYIAL